MGSDNWIFGPFNWTSNAALSCIVLREGEVVLDFRASEVDFGGCRTGSDALRPPGASPLACRGPTQVIGATTFQCVEIKLVGAAEAARTTGKDVSGISRRLKSGSVLGTSESVLIVDGALVLDLEDLVEQIAPLAVDVDSLRQRVAELENDLMMARHELQMERSNAAQDLAALAEMAQRLSARIRQS